MTEYTFPQAIRRIAALQEERDELQACVNDLRNLMNGASEVDKDCLVQTALYRIEKIDDHKNGNGFGKSWILPRGVQ